MGPRGHCRIPPQAGDLGSRDCKLYHEGVLRNIRMVHHCFDGFFYLNQLVPAAFPYYYCPRAMGVQNLFVHELLREHVSQISLPVDD